MNPKKKTATRINSFSDCKLLPARLRFHISVVNKIRCFERNEVKKKRLFMAGQRGQNKYIYESSAIKNETEKKE